MVKCQTPSRNFCTPDGKNAALFVDLDGTAVVCQPYFDEAAENFAHFMSLRGFDAAEARKACSEFNGSFMREHGFERDVFPRALVAAYNHLVEKDNRRLRADKRKLDERIVHNIGLGPFFRLPQLFSNCAAVLGRAHKGFLVFAVSMGNHEAQKYKIRQAGLDTIFDEAMITSKADKPEIVKQVMEDWNISPEYSAFIGNSRTADGACLAVTNFIYLPLEHGTEFDLSKELPQSDFEVFEVKDWREAEEKGIKRLLRRRKAAPEAAEPRALSGKGCCK
ncbi:MAG TPA: HAD family hydrolase [Candidatus Obscuribacterales bacterium]